MKTKFCTTCKQDKPVSEFRPSKTKKDGLQSKCISCDKAYAKQYYEKNKQQCIERTRKNTLLFNERFQEFKETLKCSKCDEDDSCCLEFHHEDPTEKEFNVSQLAAYGNWSLLMEEVEKCIVLCSNCHKKVHKYGLEKV